LIARFPSIESVNISWYQSIQAFKSEKITLQSELERIKFGFYADLVLPCRKVFSIDKGKYSLLKSKLPAVTFCGVFEGGHKSENIVDYNGLIVGDLDHIGELDLQDVKTKLFEDKHVLAIWTSPSGNGLKFLIRIDSEVSMHKFAFSALYEYFLREHQVHMDKSGSDVCRLCFVSDDPNLLMKETSTSFSIDESSLFETLLTHAPNRPQSLNVDSKIQAKKSILEFERVMLFKTEGKNRREDKELAKKIYAFLKRNGKSITRTYSEWLKLSFAIANSFTYDVGRPIFLSFCRLDGLLHDEYKSEWLLKYSYLHKRPLEVNFASVIYLASQHGFSTRQLNTRKIE
jgi:VirE N-terminal domain